MPDPALSRHLAQSTLDALKKAGHIVVAGGGGEAAARELSALIEPVLARILPKIQRSPIMGEVSSTFGDEATDEMVEELVAELREALLDSDSVEDVFADDRVIERVIFLSLRDALRSLEVREDEDDEEIPPISVRLDTLGYVAAAAAKGADQDTLRDALDRAAEAAQSELGAFDPDARVAIFKPTDPDPERRIEIEAAIEEELSDLVDLGVVDLPTQRRTLPLPDLTEPERKALRRRLDELAKRHLAAPLCPGTWDWGPNKTSVVLSFTPLSEPDGASIDRMVQAFLADLDANAPTLDPPTPDAPVRDSAPSSAPRVHRTAGAKRPTQGDELSKKGIAALLDAIQASKPAPARAKNSVKSPAKPSAVEAAPKPVRAAKKKAVKKADP